MLTETKLAAQLTPLFRCDLNVVQLSRKCPISFDSLLPNRCTIGINQVDLPLTALDDPAYLSSLADGYIPRFRESWTQFQPWTANLRSFSPTQSGTLHARSVASPLAYTVPLVATCN